VFSLQYIDIWSVLVTFSEWGREGSQGIVSTRPPTDSPTPTRPRIKLSCSVGELVVIHCNLSTLKALEISLVFLSLFTKIILIKVFTSQPWEEVLKNG
jgi:hypothetical protein